MLPPLANIAALRHEGGAIHFPIPACAVTFDLAKNRTKRRRSLGATFGRKTTCFRTS
jgi:hypothetical protein